MGAVEDNTVDLEGAEEREYQLELAAELLEKPEQDTIVQGDVGLGKTETALMSMAARSNENEGNYSAMVVVPNERLESQWVDRLREYDMEFDFRTNEPAGDQRLGSLKNSIPDSEKKERLEQHFEGEGFEERKKRAIRDSDVFITTYQLLSSDIRNDRLSDLSFSFDDIVVDEATHLISNITMDDADDNKSFVPGYKVDERFHDFADAFAGSRMIGLTALPGKKIGPMEDIIGAEVISPSEENASEHIQNVYSVENVFEDEDMENIVKGVNLDFSNTVQTFKDAVYQEYGARPDANKAYQFMGDENDHIENAARSVLSLQSQMAKVSETMIYPEVSGWSFTPKGEFVEGITDNLAGSGEQYLAFATHVSTAENMAKIAGGNVGIVTGQNTKTENQNQIEKYKNGELDGLVMTYGAGGEGLDLGETDRIIHTSSYISEDEKISATGRGKRNDGVIEHNLTYDFEPDVSSTQAEFLGREPDYSEESMESVRAVLSEEEEAEGQELGWTDFQ